MNNPNGDPTPRTIEQVRQAIAALREIFDAKFYGYDKAIDLLQEASNRQPTPGTVDERLTALKEIVEIRFHELDVRTNALALSNKNSIDLALQAAKEAAAKSENAVSKQIEAISAQHSQAVSSLETRINDTKEQVITIVAGGQGSRQSYGVIYAIAGISISFVGVMVLIISKVI
ncbi:hypothetical protein [Rhizobium leguminosarum]|uniref:hypothetical protein n=1 Tax=Rhizobium leguminosarum TaxID=384 RepID=UPI00047F97F8|nr:hypothetical protein [Rhizobium leguminosarum]